MSKTKKGTDKSTASLVYGIIDVLFGLFALSCYSETDEELRGGKATAGMVLGIIEVIVGAIALLMALIGAMA